jgi:hypothetical protein
MTEITEILQYFNESGGIPIKVITTQNWSQLFVVLLFGSIVTIYFVYSLFREDISNILSLHYLNKIKKITGKHVIFIKHTRSSFFESSMIDIKTILSIEKALSKFNGESFDIFLHTPGGDIFSSRYISQLLLKFNNVNVYVPLYAMSGGTLLALSCNKIFMGKHAVLGPVDPQIGTLFRFGSAESWQHVINTKGDKSTDTSIQMAFLAKQYSNSIKVIVKELLNIKSIENEQLLNLLTSGEIEHGKPLTGLELLKYGLYTELESDEIHEISSKIISSSFYEGVYYL